MRGLLSGIAGGVCASFVNRMLVGVLRFGTLYLTDFAGVMIFGRRPAEGAELLLAWGAHLGYSAVMGTVFAYLIQGITSRYILFKGGVFGVTVWFSAYIITGLYRVPYIWTASLPTAVTHFLASAAYGIVLAAVLRWFDRLTLLQDE